MASSECPSLENWQFKAATIRERNELMLNNEFLSDMHFLVGKDKVRIPGHKYVLAISSPVFFAMFYGQIAEQTADITVTDTEVEFFMEMLRFVYADHAILTLDNVLGVLYLAEKYILPFLAEKCVNFVAESLHPNNVLTVLRHAGYLAKEGLQEKCWEMIDTHTVQVLESESFMELNLETLLLLVQRNSISVREIQLFKAVCSWSERECVRRGMTSCIENKKVVASKVLQFVRFPLMSPKEFADDVASTGLLSYEETTNVFLFFFSSHKTKLPFSDVPRSPRITLTRKSLRCCRFKSCCGNDWFCDTRKHDAVQFTVDKAVYIKGIGLYGASKVDGDYTINVELLQDAEVLTQRKSSYFSDTSASIHDILFERTILIKKDVVYKINVLLKGPCSLSGRGGYSEVATEGVTFTFLDHRSANGTSVSMGQIPEIIFHL